MKQKIAGFIVLVMSALIVTSCPNAVTPVQDKVISLVELSGVSAPVKGTVPVTSIDTAEYTGVVSWSPEVSGNFASATVYTAAITLTAKSGYTLSGVKENSFTVAGAESCTNAADSGIVKAVFPATLSDTISLLAISGVSAPVKGETPVTSIDATEYTGVVSWSPEVPGTFVVNIVYTATITLKPKTGYTLSGVKENSFTVAGAETCTNAADSGIVKAVFSATAASSAKAVTSFSFSSPMVTGSIDESTHTIRMKVPAGTDASSLKPVITHTGKSISPASGESTNFSSPVQYTVTAEDGTTQVYTVMVVPLPTAPEMLINRDFTFKDSYWEIFQGNGADAVHDFSSGSYVISGSSRGTNFFDVGIQQRNLQLDKYSIYEFSFDAVSSIAEDVLSFVLEEGGVDRNGDGSTFTPWSRLSVKLSTTTQRYTVRLLTKEFDDPTGVITFFFGGSTSGTITLDNISLKKTGTWTPPVSPEMLYNGDFSLGSAYWTSWNEVTSTSGTVGDFSDGKFTLSDSERGSEDWHLQLSSDGYLNYQKGEVYTVTFYAASSTEDDQIRLNAGENGIDVNGDGYNYTEWGSESFILTNTMTSYTMTFTMDSVYDDPYGRLNFCIGNTSGTITIDNVSVKPAE